MRIGGHYFFKVAFRTLESHTLHDDGKITAENWVTPRVKGDARPSPLRGFTFTSVPWDRAGGTSEPCLSRPASIIFGGAETAYPFGGAESIVGIACGAPP